MSTADDLKLHQFLAGPWTILEEQFNPGPDWLRPPLLLSPEQAVVFQVRNGIPADPRWMIVVCKPTTDSERPDEPVSTGGIQAVLPFADLDELVNTPLDVLARRLALCIAARTYHDALDNITLDGQLVVNPHGTPEQIDEALRFIREYLGEGTTGE